MQDPGVPLNPPRARMSPWMVVAIVLGGCAAVGLVIVAVAAAVLFPAFAQAREAARTVSCQSNLKQLSTGLLMYASDYDDTLPPKSTWGDSVMPYVKNTQVYACPSAPDLPVGYAFNSHLDGLKMSKVQSPDLQPMLFDSLLGQPNGSDDLGSFALRHYHRSGPGKAGSIAFVNGAVTQDTAAPAAGPVRPE